MLISVIGTGYLGAVHAAGMAALGHDVIGVDTDATKIEALRHGDAPFFEPGLPELLRSTVSSGRLRFATSLAEAAAARVHFVCVGTPQMSGSDAADLRHVEAVIDGLAPLLGRDHLVVGKSTVPVGTAARLGERLRVGAGNRGVAALAWNPEFLREGFAVQDTLEPDRLVIGVTDVEHEMLLREVYAPMLAGGTPCVVTDLATAELVKVAANSFLATKISFIDTMAEVCEATGADVVAIADAIGLDVRIGRRFLNAGVGFGGGCLGKDIRAFRARSQELGVGDAVEFLSNVDSINERRRRRVVALAAEAVGGDLTRCQVTVLGAAFKPNSDDVRDSPALDVARRLHAGGAAVRVHDPEAISNARRVAPELEYFDSIAEAVVGSDVVVHLTEWDEYAAR